MLMKNNSFCKNISCTEYYDSFTNRQTIQCCLYAELHSKPMSKIQNWLTYYSSSYLVLPAIFFNLLSLLVLSNYFKRNRSSTTINCYMKYLCIVDMLTIFSKLILLANRIVYQILSNFYWLSLRRSG